MDDEHRTDNPEVQTHYVNHFRVGYNAFEFIVDFGRSSEDLPDGEIYTRLITAPIYVQVLCSTLAGSIGEYEEKFGSIPKPA